ncbi:hypothetical protein OIO90_006394 [Microbotryomycetes sp. JL221]|nr:hypothetical protein OIO90_006394 [Microbotryomycetes sp. JL221]
MGRTKRDSDRSIHSSTAATSSSSSTTTMTDLVNNTKPEPSLAATQPHVTPIQQTKQKTKRSNSTQNLKKLTKSKQKAIERNLKLDQRRNLIESKQEKKKKARLMWD